MKLVYFVQEKTVNSNCDVIGVFNDHKKALECSFERINECTSNDLAFNIVGSIELSIYN